MKSVEAELQRVQPIVTDLARLLSAGVLKNRESTEQLVFSFITGQASWLFNEPFKLNGWVMSTIAFKDEIGFDAIDVRHAAVHVLGCVLVFLFAASVLLFRAHLAGHRELWSTALFWSLVLGACFAVTIVFLY